MKGIPDPVEAEPDRKKTRVRQRTKQNYNNVVVKKNGLSIGRMEGGANFCCTGLYICNGTDNIQREKEKKGYLEPVFKTY